MATLVYFMGTRNGVWKCNKTYHIFQIVDNKRFSTLDVESFENGIATVVAPRGSHINPLIEALVGCFDEDSNFGTEVMKAYNCDENNTFTGIQFTFNGIPFTITKDHADKDIIYKEYRDGIDAYYAWLTETPEGQEDYAQYKAEKARKEAFDKEMFKIDKTIEMEFKNDEAKKVWDNFTENYPYMDSLRYACCWAKCMQKLIAEGNTISEIADKTSHDCDTLGKITDDTYIDAVLIFSNVWKYGEELRKWHNKDYGYEGDGVVNPAVLTIGALLTIN